MSNEHRRPGVAETFNRQETLADYFDDVARTPLGRNARLPLGLELDGEDFDDALVACAQRDAVVRVEGPSGERRAYALWRTEPGAEPLPLHLSERDRGRK